MNSHFFVKSNLDNECDCLTIKFENQQFCQCHKQFVKINDNCLNTIDITNLIAQLNSDEALCSQHQKMYNKKSDFQITFLISLIKRN